MRQGDIISPMIFNIMVDAVVRHWKTIKAGTDETGFYADDGILAGTDSTDVQSNFATITAAFASLGLKMNAKKTEFLSTRGKYRAYHLTETAHKFKHGGGEGVSQTEKNKEKVTCARCGASVQRRRLLKHQ